MIRIKIAKDYSKEPGPRYEKEGSNSGEVFRREVLYPKVKEALENNEKIIVDLDGTAGYGTSFLEESFGGLIREDHIDYHTLLSLLEIISVEEPDIIEEIKEDLSDAYNKITNK